MEPSRRSKSCSQTAAFRKKSFFLSLKSEMKITKTGKRNGVEFSKDVTHLTPAVVTSCGDLSGEGRSVQLENLCPQKFTSVWEGEVDMLQRNRCILGALRQPYGDTLEERPHSQWQWTGWRNSSPSTWRKHDIFSAQSRRPFLLW